jgi:hypothetical protein
MKTFNDVIMYNSIVAMLSTPYSDLDSTFFKCLSQSEGRRRA